jgi:hypothetical protein
MTVVNLIMQMRLFLKEQINIIIMGATAKGNSISALLCPAEERIFVSTNYFEELTNFFPKTSFRLYFVGPELSTARNGKTCEKNPRLTGSFFKGAISEFLLDRNILEGQELP